MQNKQLVVLTCGFALASACGGSASEEPYESPPPAATAGDELNEVTAEPEPVAEPTPPPPAPEPAAKPAEPPPPMPTAGAIVELKVKDYDAWKAKFEQGEAARIRGGVVGHAISRDADGKNAVVVWLATMDVDGLKAFLDSKELKASQKEAGVQGKPKVTLMTTSDAKPSEGSKAAVMVSHKVKDYDAWKEGFDADESARAEAGITGYSIGQDPKNPNSVYVYLEADDLDALREFAKSDELKKAMKEAGVVGKPKMTFLTVEEMKFYDPTAVQAAASAEAEAPSEDPAPAAK